MLGDVLRLVRAPLAATAIADGAAGYLLATVRFAREVEHHPDAFPHEPLRDPKPLLLAALASTALYWAGMALNDWFDLERDRKLYPFRPLPSGKMATNFALGLGVALLAAGVGAGFAGAGLRGALVAAATAAAILAYDGLLKRWRMPGSLAMGACRAGNVLLGGTIALAHVALGSEGTSHLHVPYAVAIGLYVFSLTLLSTFEDEDAPGSALALGFLGVVAVPLALAALLPFPARALPFLAAHGALAVALAAKAVQRGTKSTGHQTTRWLLRGLLLLDAGALAGSGFPVAWALLVVALIVPNVVGATLLFRAKRVA